MRLEAPALRPALNVDLQRGTVDINLASVEVSLQRESQLASAVATSATFANTETDGDDPGTVRAGDDAAAVPLPILAWDAPGRIWTMAPAALPAGRFTVVVVDPRGKRIVAPNAFEILGPDVVPPNLLLLQPDDAPSVLGPDATVGQGQLLTGTLIADDGWGVMQSVHWETDDGALGDCTNPDATGTSLTITDPRHAPESKLTCPFAWRVPLLLATDALTVPSGFRAWAIDAAGNRVDLSYALQVARLPTIAKFAASAGGLGGFQPFTIWGSGFLPGTRALLDGIPLVSAGASPGGDLQGESLITGWTPPRNRPGLVRVQVQTPAGTVAASTYFEYLAPPRPREVQPNHGPRRGGFRVTISGNDLRPGAAVFVGQTVETRQPLTYPVYQEGGTFKLTACMPPGNGTVSLWVYDPVAGDGALAAAFTYGDGPPLDSDTPLISEGCR